MTTETAFATFVAGAPFTLAFDNMRVPIRSFAEASRIYVERRDSSGLGSSQFPDGAIWVGDHEAARVSYNGRVWSPEPWRDGDEPLYDPRSQ